MVSRHSLVKTSDLFYVADMASPNRAHTAPAPIHDNVSRVVAGLMGLNREKQAQIAHVLGVAPSGVSEKLNGKRDWSIEDLQALGAHWDVGPGVFFTPAEEVFRGQNWKDLMAPDVHLAHNVTVPEEPTDRRRGHLTPVR